MTLTDVRSVAADSVVANAMAGKTQEFLTGISLLELAIVAAAAGMFCTFLVGNATFVEDQEFSSADRFPIFPDDVLENAAGIGGDRIVLKLRNSTAGAIINRSQIRINPA